MGLSIGISTGSMSNEGHLGKLDVHSAELVEAPNNLDLTSTPIVHPRQILHGLAGAAPHCHHIPIEE